MQIPTTGRDELSAHNKYHFCVRWFRLDGNKMDAADAEQLRISCVTYVDSIVRSFADHCMLACPTEIYQWTNVEYVRVAKFMDKHEIGKPKSAGRRSSAGGQVGALLAGKSDLRLRLIFTLAYWMQKLDDHGLLRYPDYRNFSNWSLRVLGSWLRAGSSSAGNSNADALGDFLPEDVPGAGSSLGGTDRPALCGFSQHFMPTLASNPVRVINTVYTFQRLGLCRADWAALELWNAFQDAWASAEPGRWKEYILGLTHFVLNESNFYQDAVDLACRIHDLAEALEWILDYFNEHISSLVGLGDPDLLAEVALCFLFSGRTKRADRESCAKCIFFIERCLQVDLNSLTVTGRLPAKYVFRGGPGSGGRGLKAEEHTNAVCFLALGFWARSASGRRLVSYSGPVFANLEWKKYCDMYMTDAADADSDSSP